MKAGLVVAVLACSAMFAGAATGQHVHGTSSTVIVDGKDHPEKIPESVAYLNFLLQHSVSAQPTDEALYHQTLKLNMLRLSSMDNAQLRTELVKFRAAFDEFNGAYTKQAEKGLVREDTFWSGVANLVAQTRANLNRNLSALGKKQFESGVQELRRNTVYQTGGAQ